MISQEKKYTAEIRETENATAKNVTHAHKSLKDLTAIAKEKKQRILILVDKEGQVSRYNVYTGKFEAEKINRKKLNHKRKINFKQHCLAS